PAGGQTANTWWGTLNVDKRQGVYLQDQIKISHDVHLLAGLRYSKVTFDSQDDVSGVFVTAFGVDPSTIRATRSDSAVTPRLGMLWEARPGTSLYASYSENFGNYQANFDWLNKALDPQLAKQKEIGVKQQSADGKLSSSLAIFDIRKTNEAIVDPAHTGCRDGTMGIIGAGNPCYMAAGLTRSQGIELDLIGEVMPGWNLIANYSYNNARILNNGGGTGEGQRLGYYPAHMARLATTYAIRGGWKIGGGVTSMGSTDLGNTSPTQTISPGYTLYDAMASYDFRLASYKAAFQLNIKNLFDKSYLVTAQKNGAFSITPHGDLRSVLAKLKLDF
ncbi:MAG: TonB-dependent receptor, partial [Gallionella sp.]